MLPKLEIGSLQIYLRIEMGSYQVTKGPKDMTAPQKRQKRMTRETHRDEGHVNTEAVIGVKRPQTKGHQEPPEEGRGKKEIPPQPRVFRGNVPLHTP